MVETGRMKRQFCSKCVYLKEGKHSYDGYIEYFVCGEYHEKLKIYQKRRNGSMSTDYWVERCQKCMEEDGGFISL